MNATRRLARSLLRDSSSHLPTSAAQLNDSEFFRWPAVCTSPDPGCLSASLLGVSPHSRLACAARGTGGSLVSADSPSVGMLEPSSAVHFHASPDSCDPALLSAAQSSSDDRVIGTSLWGAMGDDGCEISSTVNVEAAGASIGLHVSRESSPKAFII